MTAITPKLAKLKMSNRRLRVLPLVMAVAAQFLHRAFLKLSIGAPGSA